VAQPNLIGKTLGKYQVLEEIGRGGMGAVYRGYDPSLDRSVAIKVLAPHLVWERDFVQRFLQEARTAARLQHPHIVAVYDIGEQDGTYYIVMQYVDGRPLDDVLRQEGPLPPERAAAILAQVASALEAAHREGLVHRDVKPANILLRPRDQAVLTDFGIARALAGTRLTQTGMMVGTPGYISPEQIRGQEVGPAADQYALGVVAYELLAGGPPFAGDTPTLLHAHVYDPPPPLRARKRELSTAVEGVVLRALAKEPGQRWASVGEFARQLQAAAGGREAAAAQPRAAVPARRGAAPGQRRLGPLAGGAAALLLALAIAVGALLGGGGDGRDGRGNPAPTIAPGVAQVTTGPTDTPHRPTVGPRATEPPEPLTSTPVAPTDTPRPKTPKAGDTQTRAKDGMIMVYVPAGEFLMGSTDADSSAADDEKPQHTVTLDAFWIDRTEVTNAQYRRCVEAGACQEPGCWDNDAYNAPDQPVVCVSRDDAQAYAAWVGGRLPTEAEWEKAARGSDGRVYPWGNEAPDCKRANYWGKDGSCVGHTAVVGSYPTGASPYGALDMAGNVWEWVNDWYDSDYYANSPTNNPKGPDSGDFKVLRGGSWDGTPIDVRAAHRSVGSPSGRNDLVGFRCAAGSPGG
jgi:formylglycine-generating enzyme required for sulfatase activity/predicted Ser/Thr protein kinase